MLLTWWLFPALDLTWFHGLPHNTCRIGIGESWPMLWKVKLILQATSIYRCQRVVPKFEFPVPVHSLIHSHLYVSLFENFIGIPESFKFELSQNLSHPLIHWDFIFPSLAGARLRCQRFPRLWLLRARVIFSRTPSFFIHRFFWGVSKT